MNTITESIAFYNVENLFDYLDTPESLDKSFTLDSKKNWTKERYHRKLDGIALAISKMKNSLSGKLPFAIGLAEVENKKVLKDLLDREVLKPYPYDFIHYDSPDERGIDVALLYDKSIFSIDYSKNYRLDLYDDQGNSEPTRDILLVKGRIQNEDLYLIVNHWPSRRSGNNFSKNKRKEAAKLVRNILNFIQKENPEASVILMGDFNSNPNDAVFKYFLETVSVAEVCKDNGLFNPMEDIHKKGKGTVKHRRKWNLFDQFLVTKPLISEVKSSNFQLLEVEIFKAEHLFKPKGKNKGNPFRTYLGNQYTAGFSDHFPILLHLSKEV